MNPASALHDTANENQLAAPKFDEIGHATLLDEVYEFLRGGLTGVNDDIYVDAAEAFTETGVLDSSYGSFGTEVGGRVAGKQIGAIIVGNCNQKIGVRDVDFLEN